jgi:hypothetical protein
MKQSQHFLENAENCAQLAERATDEPQLQANGSRLESLGRGAGLAGRGNATGEEGGRVRAASRDHFSQSDGLDQAMTARAGRISLFECSGGLRLWLMRAARYSGNPALRMPSIINLLCLCH